MNELEFLEKIKSYSLNELYEVYAGIDSEKFPERIIAVKKLIDQFELRNPDEVRKIRTESSNYLVKLLMSALSFGILGILIFLHVPDVKHGFASKLVVVSENIPAPSIEIVLIFAAGAIILMIRSLELNAILKSAIVVCAFIVAIGYIGFKCFPYYYTKLYGEKFEKQGIVTEMYNVGPKGCRKSIGIKIPTQPEFTKLCTDDEKWNETHGYTTAKFEILESRFGVILEDFNQDYSVQELTIDTSFRSVIENIPASNYH